MSGINWIAVIVGALAGALIQQLIKVPAYLLSLLRKSPLEGVWHEYHITKEYGKFIVVHDVLEIRKGFPSKLNVKTYRDGKVGNSPNAKGEALFERQFLIMKMKTTDHDEEILIRLANPIPSSKMLTSGIWLGIDYDTKSIAAPIILANKELPRNEAADMLIENTKINQKMKAISA
jgi:hypothetical protein